MRVCRHPFWAACRRTSACPRARPSRPSSIEADDTPFCDKRSKFVHYRPRTAILNNLEFDHADIFADLGAIETQFHHLVRTIPASGRIVANAHEGSALIMKRLLVGAEWFGGDGRWTVDRVRPRRCSA